jgi:hypothetical protein
MRTSDVILLILMVVLTICLGVEYGKTGSISALFSGVWTLRVQQGLFLSWY